MERRTLWAPGSVVSRPSITSLGSGASLTSGVKSSTQDTAQIANKIQRKMRDILSMA